MSARQRVAVRRRRNALVVPLLAVVRRSSWWSRSPPGRGRLLYPRPHVVGCPRNLRRRLPLRMQGPARVPRSTSSLQTVDGDSKVSTYHS